MVGGPEILLLRLSHMEESCDRGGPEKNTKKNPANCYKLEENS